MTLWSERWRREHKCCLYVVTYSIITNEHNAPFTWRPKHWERIAFQVGKCTCSSYLFIYLATLYQYILIMA